MSKHKSSVVKASGYLAAFNHKLFSGVEELGIPDERLYELLKGEEDFMTKIVKVFAESAGMSIRRTLAEMVKACGLDPRQVDADVTEEHFPVRPELFTARTSRVFHFGREMTTSQVEADIRAEGYEPDPIEKLLAYGKDHPDEQRLYPIVALGSSWVDRYGSRNVPDLCGSAGARKLGLYWVSPEGRWSEPCRFLVSPRKSST